MKTSENVQAGPELDAEIARRVFGHESATVVNANLPSKYRYMKTDCFTPRKCKELGYCPEGGCMDMPHYSTDIAEAWLVVEKMRERGWRFVVRDGAERGVPYVVTLWGPHDGSPTIVHVDEGDTAPLAICRAALAALEKG